MHAFKAGDRVEYVNEEPYSFGPKPKATGTVLVADPNIHEVIVQFDLPVNRGHSAAGIGKHPYCWYCHYKFIAPEEKIDVEEIL